MAGRCFFELARATEVNSHENKKVVVPGSIIFYMRFFNFVLNMEGFVTELCFSAFLYVSGGLDLAK